MQRTLLRVCAMRIRSKAADDGFSIPLGLRRVETLDLDADAGARGAIKLSPVTAVLAVEDRFARTRVDGEALGEIGVAHDELCALDTVPDRSRRRRTPPLGGACAQRHSGS